MTAQLTCRQQNIFLMNEEQISARYFKSGADMLKFPDGTRSNGKLKSTIIYFLCRFFRGRFLLRIIVVNLSFMPDMRTRTQTKIVIIRKK